MRTLKNQFKLILLLVSILFTFTQTKIVQAETHLTEEEQAFIQETPVIEAVSLAGSAPLQYYDEEGEVQGISKEILEKISRETGLEFSYYLMDSLEEALNANADIIFGIPNNYAPEDLVLSIPFLETESVIYINSTVDPNELELKTYAVVYGKELPDNVSPDGVKYYDTREAAIEAVNKGEADYSFGNPYSVSFYLLQKNLDDVITIPEGQEERQYRIGMLQENPLLLSIINKGISPIEENEKQTLIINAMAQVEREITIPIIMESYGVQILGLTLLVLLIILFYFIQNVRTKNQLEIQNQRLLALSKSSNEFLYEYNYKSRSLKLAPRTQPLFVDKSKLTELEDLIHQFITTLGESDLLELQITDEKKGVFRSVNTKVLDKNGHLHSVIGKLLDVSEEEAEKQDLLQQSRRDGLTGLYNSTTTRKLIEEKINALNPQDKVHALILIDGDRFELINDTYGHLVGDRVIVNIGKALTETFPEAEIIGRMGGDEFSIFFEDVPSKEFLESKFEQLFRLVRVLNPDFEVNVSAGIAFQEAEDSYEVLFERSDQAMYRAKEMEGSAYEFQQ